MSRPYSNRPQVRPAPMTPSGRGRTIPPRCDGGIDTHEMLKKQMLTEDSDTPYRFGDTVDVSALPPLTGGANAGSTPRTGRHVNNQQQNSYHLRSHQLSRL